jgi:hypothetical protein
MPRLFNEKMQFCYIKPFVKAMDALKYPRLIVTACVTLFAM